MIIEKTATSKRMQMMTESNKRTAKLIPFDENADKKNWKLIRKLVGISYALVPKAKGVKITKIQEENIRGYLCTPKDLDSNDIVICIHGGGMLFGSAYGSLGFSSDIAKNAGMKVYDLDYSLAPEHKFPQGIDDVYRAYQEIIARHPDSKIFLTGESAGAYLYIVLTCLCIKNNIKKPAAIFPHSPVIDFSGTLDRSYPEMNDALLKEGSLKGIQKLYCPNEDMKDYRLSPMFFDEFEQFPPTIITVSGNEYLRKDSEKLYQILKENDVEAKLYLYHNTYHGFAVTGSMAKESAEILKENIALMKQLSL